MKQLTFNHLFLLSGLLVVVTAEPTATATILSPEADRKEGGQVHMRCIATNLDSDLHTEWTTEDPKLTLRWDNYTLTTEQRFRFTTTTQPSGQTIQNFIIIDLQRSDTDEYVCNVNNLSVTSGNRIVASHRVNLSVLYFPKESPVCSPAGPFTIDNGTELSLQCSSDGGNRAVTMNVSEIPQRSHNYSWTLTTDSDTVTRSLDLTVDSANDNMTFECIISSAFFPYMNSSCTIGPIHVASYVDGNTGAYIITVAPIASGVAVLVLLLILIVICRRRGLCNFNPKHDDTTNTDMNSNSAHVVFSPHQVAQSHPNSYAETGFEVHSAAQSNSHSVYQEPDQVPQTAGSVDEPGTSVASTVPGGLSSGQVPEPHYENSEHERMLHRSQLGVSSIEPGFANPAFDSNESEEPAWVSDENGITNLATEVVPTGKPKPAPKPFKPKLTTQKSIEDNTLNSLDDWVTSPPPVQSAPKPPLSDGDRQRTNLARSPDREVPSYAQVSVPQNKRQPERKLRSDDHIVYADLDMKSESLEDEGVPPPSNLYASVTKLK